MPEKVNDMLQKLSDIILLDDWDKINELLNTIAFDRMPSSEKDDENAEIFKNNQSSTNEFHHGGGVIFNCEGNLNIMD